MRRFVPLAAVLLGFSPALAQEADTLDARGYFPLAVENEWEYRHDLDRPRDGGARTEYLRFRVVSDGVGPGADEFTLVEERFTATGAPLTRDTASVRYTPVEGYGTTYLCVSDRETTDGGEVYERPVPFFACDLDLAITDPFDELGNTPPGRVWMYAARVDPAAAEYVIPPFLPAVELSRTKEFYHMGGASFAAVHGLGFVSGGRDPDGCTFLCESDEWALTYARVDGREYGTRAVGTEGPPRPQPSPLALYPNPARRAVTVRAAPGVGRTVEVYDVAGRLVRSSALPPSGVGPLDLSGLPTGVYVVRAGGEVGRVVVR